MARPENTEEPGKTATPDAAATPEQMARRVARKEFKSARTAWVDAKARIKQIKALIEAGTPSNTEKKALQAEKRALKAKLPDMAETVRSTKAAWVELKDDAEGPGPSDAGS
jgi:hypothetical protein